MLDKLDDIDLELLRILQKNSKLTIKQLAAEVNLSSSPVFERIKRLEHENFIKNYSAILDAEKLEKDFIVFCQIKLRNHDKNIGNHFVEEIMKIEEITECYNISGEFDFLLKVQIKDMKHYQNFVYNKLGSLESIGDTHSTFVMSTIKNMDGFSF